MPYAYPPSASPSSPSPPRLSPPPVPIQVNALQAMCRQLFAFRLAMTALAAPFALSGVGLGIGAWLVGAAVLVTVMGSYVLLRDWERFGPILLRHPSLLAADMLFGALLLFSASPGSTLTYVTLCTPLLAGLVYGWRGAAIFAPLQTLLLTAAYAVDLDTEADAAALLMAGLCVLAGAVGSSLRGLLLRFGAASQALSEARARLAVRDAVEEERARLAREMHDSVAKTLHGLSLAAESLAHGADRLDPAAVRRRAEAVAHAARRAAAESRNLLTDLRATPAAAPAAAPATAPGNLFTQLAARAEHCERAHGVRTVFHGPPGPDPEVALRIPPATSRQVLAIVEEALENACRHARPTAVELTAEVTAEVTVEVTVEAAGDVLRISVYDDGPGLPPGTCLETLRRNGHFGMLGMVERAASIGARIRIGRGRKQRGTEVRLELPAPAAPIRVPPEPDAPRARSIPTLL
ncbi:sensor histidine kinase [Streptomyces sp. PR69]|uniref:sensor histidine kinase n=1 Tax=Streptomyces sp. PR69 TaxID=2984950 RepID=UPI0022649F03|nr:histidine kinase [Streptomyces sp. PR69]